MSSKHKSKNVPISEADDLEIRCLLSDIAVCPYRARLNWHFGTRINIECPHREKLRKAFRKYLKNKKVEDGNIK